MTTQIMYETSSQMTLRARNILRHIQLNFSTTKSGAPPRRSDDSHAAFRTFAGSNGRIPHGIENVRFDSEHEEVAKDDDNALYQLNQLS